jgi:hypothetical protein
MNMMDVLLDLKLLDAEPFSIDGSAKAENGYYLNETEAGGGGRSYFFSVYYGITRCGVDGGTGCPTYGGICWCEVQCGCQLYRI